MPNTLKGTAYLAEHPQARAQDLKDAFLDDSVAGIICAIGGDDTYRLLPYLMEDTEFIEAVKKLPYTRKAFESYLEGNEYHEIVSSEIWYEERTDFSRAAIGTERVAHREERGFELLQGKEIFQGRLLGDCLESPKMKHIMRNINLFLKEWWIIRSFPLFII